MMCDRPSEECAKMAVCALMLPLLLVLAWLGVDRDDDADLT